MEELTFGPLNQCCLKLYVPLITYKMWILCLGSGKKAYNIDSRGGGPSTAPFSLTSRFGEWKMYFSQYFCLVLSEFRATIHIFDYFFLCSVRWPGCLGCFVGRSYIISQISARLRWNSCNCDIKITDSDITRVTDVLQGIMSTTSYIFGVLHVLHALHNQLKYINYFIAVTPVTHVTRLL